jgi:hypothetical protein
MLKVGEVDRNHFVSLDHPGGSEVHVIIKAAATNALLVGHGLGLRFHDCRTHASKRAAGWKPLV